MPENLGWGAFGRPRLCKRLQGAAERSPSRCTRVSKTPFALPCRMSSFGACPVTWADSDADGGQALASPVSVIGHVSSVAANSATRGRAPTSRDSEQPPGVYMYFDQLTGLNPLNSPLPPLLSRTQEIWPSSARRSFGKFGLRPGPAVGEPLLRALPLSTIN